MARPIKDNADYFSHDATMRDDPKIKALRRRFKVEGYGIWCMLLETITDSDNFRLKVNYDILAGDFDIEPDLLRTIICYCIELELLVFDSDNSILWSKTLDKRFSTLLSKRERDRNRVFDSDNTQSKVKHSKVKKRRVITAPIPDEYFRDQIQAFETMRDDELFISDCHQILTRLGWIASDKVDVVGLVSYFLSAKAKLKNPRGDVMQHFKNWLNSEKIVNLQTRAQIFKKSLNGTATGQAAQIH